MSAGICIMNRYAIALAADSAVTIGPHLAVHNSANKLFSLSNYEPIGLIIYSSASLMGVPFEIIVKEYKRKLASKSFEKLSDYVEDFISFIEHNASYFRFNQNEENYIMNVIDDFINLVFNDYKRGIEQKIDKVKRELTEQELQKINDLTVENVKSFIKKQKKCIEDDYFSNYINNAYCNKIKERITKLEWLLDEQKEWFYSIVISLFDTEFFGNNRIGIAISGYGTNDIYPEMKHMYFGNVINNKLQFYTVNNVKIDEKIISYIEPLAQTDVMETFMFGINNSFVNAISTELNQSLEKSINELDESLFALNKKKEVEKQLSSLSKIVTDKIVEKAAKEYMKPINISVGYLPIDELALLAESMINITSIKRKVVIDQNIGTVGGPVDLAIISKSDGFIWLKRKHYFDSKLNPQYFNRNPYNRKDGKNE